MAVDQIRRLHERMPGTLHPTRQRLGRALVEKTFAAPARHLDATTRDRGQDRGHSLAITTTTDEPIGCLGARSASSVPK